mmetsp:Transcript_10263/g.32448  ORF Transcript_10263/g.32448 Transcript_10263/m.32448 type:complete len:231 (+) Transcript_10263:1227-1919(+)
MSAEGQERREGTSPRLASCLQYCARRSTACENSGKRHWRSAASWLRPWPSASQNEYRRSEGGTEWRSLQQLTWRRWHGQRRCARSLWGGERRERATSLGQRRRRQLHSVGMVPVVAAVAVVRWRQMRLPGRQPSGRLCGQHAEWCQRGMAGGRSRRGTIPRLHGKLRTSGRGSAQRDSWMGSSTSSSTGRALSRTECATPFGNAWRKNAQRVEERRRAMVGVEERRRNRR